MLFCVRIWNKRSKRTKNQEQRIKTCIGIGLMFCIASWFEVVLHTLFRSIALRRLLILVYKRVIFLFLKNEHRLKSWSVFEPYCSIKFRSFGAEKLPEERHLCNKNINSRNRGLWGDIMTMTYKIRSLFFLIYYTSLFLRKGM